MKKRKHALLSIAFSAFLWLTAVAAPTFAATIDTAANLTTLQTNLSTAMQRRLTSYTIKYSGSAATLKSDVSNIITSIWNADDYLHYSSKGYEYTISTVNGLSTLTFSFKYHDSAEQADYVSNRVTEILKQIIPPGANDYQKEKAIHDWIVKNVAYDRSLTKFSDFAALVKPYETVCNGYALLMYKMFKEAGLETRIVSGTADGVAHAWNMVLIDGVWYSAEQLGAAPEGSWTLVISTKFDVNARLEKGLRGSFPGSAFFSARTSLPVFGNIRHCRADLCQAAAHNSSLAKHTN